MGGVYRVNKKGNPRDLMFLFPNIVFASDVPRLEPVVYSSKASWSGMWATLIGSRIKDSVLLVQSNDGYPVDTVDGLTAFLRDVGYMPDTKLERLKKLDGLPAEDVYRNAAALRVSNRLFADIVDDRVPGVLDLLSMGLHGALDACLRVGASRSLVHILRSLHRFWSKDGSLSPAAYREWSYALSSLTVDVFLDRFSLSGDDEVDLMSLLAMLPYKAK